MTPEREQYIRDWSEINDPPLACQAFRELLQVIGELRLALKFSVSPQEYDFALKKQDESSRRSVARLRALERVEEFLKEHGIHKDACDCNLCQHIRICREAIDL